LFNINPIDYTYLKSNVENLKKEGVEWIFIDEVSMITSKIWSAIRDIKKIYGFKFVLFGDFYQLPSVESKHYDVVNSELFSEICDGQMLELTRNYRAENDVDFAEFIADLRIIKNGSKPDFKTMEHLNVENLYVGLIRLERLSIINGCKKNQGELIMLLLIILKYL